MNSKGIIILASVILVLILVPLSIFFLGSGVSNITNTTSSKSSPTKITLSEISKRNKESDCYMIVNRKVYDVTTYLPVHPGGSSGIVQYCGKDGTAAFDTKGGKGQHSDRADNDLSSLYVGELAN